MELTQIKVGDKIRIKVLDDSFLNMDYRNKEGIVETINWKHESIKGSWGPVEIYPEFDEIEILNTEEND